MRSAHCGTRPGQVGELGADVNAVGLDRVTVGRSPPLDVFHEQAVGTADVQEGAVAIDGIADHTSGVLPPCRVAALA